MRTYDGLLIRGVLPTLFGLTLLGCMAAAPAFAQSDRDQKMHHSMAWDDEKMFDPAPLSYPQAAPGSIHLYHWKDYTQTKMAPGSVSDKRWEMEHKQDKKRHDRTRFHRTRGPETAGEASGAGWSENNEWKDMDQHGISENNYSFWSRSPWNFDNNTQIVLWPSQSDITSGNGFVYVLRGDTITQMRVNDYLPTAQNSLPWLNNQTGYDLPVAQIEDVDVYNKTVTENIPDGNQDSERSQPGVTPYTDYTQTQPDDRSDLKGQAYYHRSAPATGPGKMMSATITVNGDYIYILRGNTLYQLRVTDLSLVNQKELPAPNPIGGDNSGNTTKGKDQHESNPDMPNP